MCCFGEVQISFHLQYFGSAHCIFFPVFLHAFFKQSIGSNGDFEFEELVVRTTHCQVHTYDCTESSPGEFESEKQAYFKKHNNSQVERVNFHNTCIGNKDGNLFMGSSLGRREFKRLQTIFEELPSHKIALLKMDIEGYEFDAIADFFTNMVKKSLLPFQIAIEVHYASQMKDLYFSFRRTEIRRKGQRAIQSEKIHGGMSAAQLALFADLFENNGYRLISREDNSGNHIASELVWMRFVC